MKRNKQKPETVQTIKQDIKELTEYLLFLESEHVVFTARLNTFIN